MLRTEMHRAAKKRRLSEEFETEQIETSEDDSDQDEEEGIPPTARSSCGQPGPSFRRKPLCRKDILEQVFTNGLIISKIVEFLPVKDLINFRLLSRIWNIEAVKKIKLHHKMIKFDLTGLTTANHEISKSVKVISSHEICSFIGIVKASSNRVFTRFSFIGNDLCHPTIVHFLETYGPVIEELKLEWNREDMALLSSFRETILYALPNLRILRLQDIPPIWACSVNVFPAWMNSHKRLDKLKIIDIHFAPHKQENFQASYKLLRGLLSLAPNVEAVPHIRLGGDESVQRGILETFANLEKDNILRAVEFTSFNVAVYELMGRLSAKSVFIRSIYFTLWDLPEPLDQAQEVEILEAVEKILRDQKSHLKYLHLEITAPQRPYINLPTLPNLTGLKIVRNSNHDVVPNVRYGTDVPKLRELCIVGGKKGFGSKLDTILALDDVFCPNPNVQKLVLVGYIETPMAITRAASIFPNVKHLSLTKAVDGAYPVLWTCWPNLEECYIKYALNVSRIDSVFTGIPPSTVNAINRELTSSERAGVWFSNSVGFYSGIAPTITRWKHLHKLFINYTNIARERPKEDSRKFSDATGCMAFSKMPSLNELVIGYSKISRSCAQILSSKIEKVMISHTCPDIPYFEETDSEN